VDHLAHRGLDQSLQCLLCDKEDETIHHIMVGCVFFYRSVVSDFILGGVTRVHSGVGARKIFKNGGEQ
jgi:hypothetical protein